jgi:hypothetical protein
VDTVVTDDENTQCDRQITEEEVKYVLGTMKQNKSPGSDGIVAEFYVIFWDIIKHEFMQVLQEIFENYELCKSQYRGVITLIYKQGDREDIKNWRPITLLNADYKIIAKILSGRLKTILPNIIHPDQKGFVQGRNISEAIRLIQDIVDYSDEMDLEGAIICLDQQKAFDRVEWGWIDECLGKFGFSHRFRKWIHMLFKYGENRILTNGYLSKSFKISRSVRQGCPIAPLLYILQAEPLAATIRKDPNVKGILLPSDDSITAEAKLVMFADDTHLLNRTEQSINANFEILHKYEKASGAKMNFKKTQGMYIGKWKNKKPKYNRITWTNKPVKTLGVLHGYNIDNDQIWRTKLEKVKNCLHVWKTRDLSYKGKVLILKSLVLSTVGYEIEMRGIPEAHLKTLKTLIWNYLWDGKTPLLNRQTCLLGQEHGGLSMFDIDSIVKCKQVKLIYKIMHSTTQTWNILGKHWLKSYDTHYADSYFVCKCSSTKGLDLTKIPAFYRTCIEGWTALQTKIPPTTLTDIANQPLFGNSLIVAKHKPIFFPRWAQSGLSQISDIFDIQTNTWITSKRLVDTLKVKHNWIAEFTTLKSSIPKLWIDQLKTQICSEPSKYSKLKIGDNLCLVSAQTNKIIPYSKLPNGTIAYHLQNNLSTLRPKCEAYWNTRVQIQLPWNIIWKELHSSLCSNKVKQFQWKCLHRIVFTEQKLKLIRLSNGICTLCGECEESLFHLFAECTYAQHVWKTLSHRTRNIINKLDLSDTNVITFGSYGADNLINKVTNLIVFTAKWHIWKAKTSNKYGKKNIKPITTINSIVREILFISNVTKLSISPLLEFLSV